MAFGQYILEMEVLVTEALRNTVDCRCSSETLEPWCRLTPYAHWLGPAPYTSTIHWFLSAKKV